jgi:hypothetical protein
VSKEKGTCLSAGVYQSENWGEALALSLFCPLCRKGKNESDSVVSVSLATSPQIPAGDKRVVGKATPCCSYGKCSSGEDREAVKNQCIFGVFEICVFSYMLLKSCKIPVYDGQFFDEFFPCCLDKTGDRHYASSQHTGFA